MTAIAEGPFGCFNDAMNIVMRLSGILNVVTKGMTPSGYLVLVGETLGLLRNIVNAARQNGYFDPPVDSAVRIPGGNVHYTVTGMKFGIKGGNPKQDRTAPILEVGSGARLTLIKSEFSNYRYSSPCGFVHVASGAVLSLEDVTMKGNTSANGVPPIVAEKGAVVWLSGETKVDRLDSGAADIRIGTGPRHAYDAQPAELKGDVWVADPTLLGQALTESAFEKSTGWSHIRSLTYDKWYEPQVSGEKVVWGFRPGKADELVPQFSEDDPFAVAMVTGKDGRRYAHLSGTLVNGVPGFYYALVGADDLTGNYGQLGDAKVAKADGTCVFAEDIPAEGFDARFFRVRVSDRPTDGE